MLVLGGIIVPATYAIVYDKTLKTLNSLRAPNVNFGKFLVRKMI